MVVAIGGNWNEFYGIPWIISAMLQGVSMIYLQN